MNAAMEDFQEQQMLQMQIDEIEANTRRNNSKKKKGKHGIAIMEDGNHKEDSLVDKFFAIFGCGPKKKAPRK